MAKCFFYFGLQMCLTEAIRDVIKVTVLWSHVIERDNFGKSLLFGIKHVYFFFAWLDLVYRICLQILKQHFHYTLFIGILITHNNKLYFEFAFSDIFFL